jgi:predicted RNase H-like nuclease (RuvC/YqgF family)
MSEDEPNLPYPLETKTVSADDRGRAYIGSEYKNSEIRIAVLDQSDATSNDKLRELVERWKDRAEGESHATTEYEIKRCVDELRAVMNYE